MRGIQPRGPRRACGTAALAMTLALAAGCEVEETSTQFRIEGPRILAISASPPVASMSGSTTISAAVTLADGADALAQPDARAEVRWRVCNPWRPLFDPRTDCGPGSSIEGSDLPASSEPFTLQLPIAALLDAFPPPDVPDGGPDGMTPDPGGCRHDYTHIEVPVVLEASVGAVQLAAIKRVRVTGDPEASQRQNPRIAGLILDASVIADDQIGSFVPGRAHGLSVSVDPASLDWICDGTVEIREPVRVHVYVTAGHLSAPFLDIDDTGTDALPSITWTAPESGIAVLWLVAIDGDGGVGWARFVLQPS